uniref:Uncharacterized protein n=1 Tax=Cacopsylla melanoneura TaxID=428564 RepID=A0A8D8RIP2_9HEMI
MNMTLSSLLSLPTLGIELKISPFKENFLVKFLGAIINNSKKIWGEGVRLYLSNFTGHLIRKFYPPVVGQTNQLLALTSSIMSGTVGKKGITWIPARVRDIA